MEPNLSILTITSLGPTPEENLRITLSAMMIKMTAARDGIVQNRPVKITTVFFVDSDPVELVLTDLDLAQVESVVGAYGFQDF